MQKTVEKQISECNSSVLSNYERQAKLELDIRSRRDHLLKQISDGKDDEMGESGLSFGKKNSQKSRGGEQDWGHGLMNSFRRGFMK